MGYVLPTGALANLASIRDEYERKARVLLTKKPPLFSMPTLFGGSDIQARKAQIELIEKMLLIFKENLLDIDDINNPRQAIATLTASKAMLGICLYIKSNIAHPHENSTLCTLINAKLGITKDNLMDKEDKRSCYKAAKRLLSAPNAMDDANLAIAEENKARGPNQIKYKPFTEDEWNTLNGFFDTKVKVIAKEDSFSNFPISSITKPLFGAVFSYAGATVGIVAGDAISHSTNGFRLTAVLGSSILILAPAVPTSMAFFAPVIASKLINTFCKVSLGHVLSVLMGLVGQAIGLGVGLPFDMVLYGLKSIANRGSSSSAPTIANQPDGLRIIDGMYMISNVAFELKSLQDLPANLEKKMLSLDDEGYLTINGERVVDPKTGTLLPKIDFGELKEAVSIKCQRQVAPAEISETTCSL